MWFGKHKDERLADIPASYFFWLWENPKGPQLYRKPGDSLHRYIVKNWQRYLKAEPDYDPANQPPRDTRTATQAPAK